jgi:hypothetical protein
MTRPLSGRIIPPIVTPEGKSDGIDRCGTKRKHAMKFGIFWTENVQKPVEGC